MQRTLQSLSAPVISYIRVSRYRKNVSISHKPQNILLTLTRLVNTKSDMEVKNLMYDDIVKKKADNSIILIDVRERNEIQETGVLPGAINIPLSELEAALKTSNEVFKTKYGIPKPDLQAPLVFSCRSGRRSVEATKAAALAGYVNSQNYKGGFIDWQEKSKKK